MQGRAARLTLVSTHARHYILLNTMTSSRDSFEDVDISPPGEASTARRFSVDDAFSDSGEDNFEFTTESIRKELAKNLRAAQSFSGDDDIGYEDIQIAPSYIDPDASVSTIDINAPSLHERALDPAVVSLPLSPEPNESHNSELTRRSNETLASTRETVDSSSGGAHHSFPSVVIDLSNPASQVTALTSTSSESSQVPSTDSSDSVTAVSDTSTRSKSKSPAAIPSSHSLPVSGTTPRPSSHRPTKSHGPSALEKVISKTRPTFLPPKAKQEDLKHLADWETMMKQSRIAGKSYYASGFQFGQ